MRANTTTGQNYNGVRLDEGPNESRVIDVCMPTYESGEVLEGTLKALKEAEQRSKVEISAIRATDNHSTDSTQDVLRTATEQNNWELDLEIVESTLPEARESLINRVETEWFLFLDDDVRISEEYLRKMDSCIASGIGAVQGRKISKTRSELTNSGIVSDVPDHPSDWVRKRAFRGGTHATLVRTKACKEITFPNDLVVWEDEYLRREIESNSYLWIFNHQAYFEHENQERHNAGWQSGYLQAKYDFRPFWHVLLNIPYAILTGKSPVGYVLMAMGYMYANFRESK